MDRLDFLDEYLLSDDAHPDSLGISDLDGFLTGIACCPEPIPVKEWLDFALGDMAAVPDDVLGVVTGLCEDIRDRLEAEDHLEPVYLQGAEGNVIAMDWCEGFMDAVKLRPERWDAFSQTKTGSDLMVPILVHMIDGKGESMFGIPQEDLEAALDAAAEAIPIVVPAIYREIRVITRN